MNKKIFWVVWSPGSGAPTVWQESKEDAVKEAERLATKHPDRVFHVLQSVSTSQVKAV
ncbi:hypothetical protein KAR91_63510 [Candidatus Pacearchaeota archaeon]|nr:hypothetical protein [Candidatus Pacearchaeota archaeon]